MASFNGLGMHMGNLAILSTAESRSISAENPTGEKGKGAMATPDLAPPSAVVSKLLILFVCFADQEDARCRGNGRCEPTLPGGVPKLGYGITRRSRTRPSRMA